MSIKDTTKGEVIVVGQKLLIPLLKDLHSTHACADTIWRMVRGIWLWPALKHDIKQYATQCPACRENAKNITTFISRYYYRIIIVSSSKEGAKTMLRFGQCRS